MAEALSEDASMESARSGRSQGSWISSPVACNDTAGCERAAREIVPEGAARAVSGPKGPLTCVRAPTLNGVDT